MKLRIHGNSIRLRLTQSEVRLLTAGQPIEDRVDLAPHPLCYRLDSSKIAANLTASFAAGELRMTAPAAEVASWAASDQVSLQGNMPGGAGGPITLLIEKDFQCLDDSQQDPDCFPNPRARAGK